MKAELLLPPELVEAIAEKVIEKLKPLIVKQDAEDTIFTPKILAQYLEQFTKKGTPNISWVYKQVSSKSIPYFKSGKYIRFRKSAIDKWIETQTVKPAMPLKLLRHIK